MTQLAPLFTQETQTAFELLSDARLAREAELQRYNLAADLSDSDEKTDSYSPMYDSFFREGGSTEIREMKIFTGPEYDALWNGVEANKRAK